MSFDPVIIEDVTGDEMKVSVAGDEVHVVPDTGNGPAPMYYTPVMARKLALVLLAAADEAEANQ